MPNFTGYRCPASAAGYFLASAALGALRHASHPSCPPRGEFEQGRNKNCTPTTPLRAAGVQQSSSLTPWEACLIPLAAEASAMAHSLPRLCDADQVPKWNWCGGLKGGGWRTARPSAREEHVVAVFRLGRRQRTQRGVQLAGSMGSQARDLAPPRRRPGEPGPCRTAVSARQQPQKVPREGHPRRLLPRTVRRAVHEGLDLRGPSSNRTQTRTEPPCHVFSVAPAAFVLANCMKRRQIKPAKKVL